MQFPLVGIAYGGGGCVWENSIKMHLDFTEDFKFTHSCVSSQKCKILHGTDEDYV